MNAFQAQEGAGRVWTSFHSPVTRAGVGFPEYDQHTRHLGLIWKDVVIYLNEY